MNKPEHCEAVMREAMSYRAPALFTRKSLKKTMCFPMVPAGKSAMHMIIEKPTAKMEKPTGST